MSGETNELRSRTGDRIAHRLSRVGNLLSILATALLLALPLVFLASQANGEVATAQEMNQVCQNWLAEMVYQQGSWAGDNNPQITNSHEIYSGDTLLARWYDISPKGFVIVPVLKEMQPIKAYSDEYNLDDRQEGGFLSMLREMLSQRAAAYARHFGSLDAPQSAVAEPIFGQGQRKEWDRLTVDTKEFKSSMPNSLSAMESAGPLLTSSWDQGAPYNNLCPMGDGGRTVVGCVATAAAQILKYWQWPPNGYGNHSYTWAGDYSCGGSTPPQTLSADFSDAYDWADMPDSCDGGCNTTQMAALAELNYEVGVAFDMDYGKCGSGAYVTTAAVVLPAFFKYSDQITLNYRVDFDLAGWYNLMKEEIDAGRVADYQINSHSIVLDGYRDDGGKYQYHMNYGWGGSFTTWFVLDSLYCYWEPNDLCPANEEMMVTKIMPQTVPSISYLGKALSDPSGNNNGRLEASESAQLSMTIRNLGIQADNVVGQLTTSDPYITIPTPTASFAASMPWGGQATTATPFVISADAGCPDPHIAIVVLTVTADGGYSKIDSTMIFVGNTKGFEDNMESGQGYWTHRSPNAQFSDQWHLETYRYHGGSASWKEGGAGSLDYSSSSDAQLITPPFLLPTHALLSFWHWVDAEVGDPGTAWDGAAVYISSGDGQWTQLTPTGGYPYTIIDNPASPYAPGTPCYSGSYTWAQADVDLSAYAGVVQLMFRFGADGAVTGEGWYIDDVSVVSQGCCGIYTGGYSGNTDCDTEGKINLGDITALIDRVYISKTPLCCEENGNVDGDAEGKINLADITAVIDHVYISHGQTALCQ